MAAVSQYARTVKLTMDLEENEPPSGSLLVSTLAAYRQSYISDLKAKLKMFADAYTTNTELTKGEWTL